MLLINYDLSPSYSLAYTSASLYSFLKNKNTSLEKAKDYFITHIIDKSSLFYFSLDFLFLIGKVKEINNGVIICN